MSREEWERLPKGIRATVEIFIMSIPVLTFVLEAIL